MKILANTTVTKLREYSRSYGNSETIEYNFIIENENSTTTLNSCGEEIRTFRKGTKLLIDFKGTEISNRAFKIRTNRAKKQLKAENEKRKIKEEKILIKKENLKQSKIYEITNFINSNINMVQTSLKELDDIKQAENKKEWQIKANSLVQKVSDNDFSNLKWREIYSLIRKY